MLIGIVLALFFLPMPMGLLSPALYLVLFLGGFYPYPFNGPAGLANIIEAEILHLMLTGVAVSLILAWNRSHRLSETVELADNRLAAAKLAEVNVKQQDYAARVEGMAKTEERTRMARDLHDILAHTLTSMIVQIGARERMIPIDPETVAAELAKVRDAARVGLNEVRAAVAAAAHVRDVLLGLRGQGTPADLVQVGNEINGGMLWKTGRVERWPDFIAMLRAGCRAVREVSPAAGIVAHNEGGGAKELCARFYAGLIRENITFDIIGLSFYSVWCGPLARLRTNLAEVFRRSIMIVETAYPWTLENFDARQNHIEPRFRTSCVSVKLNRVPVSPNG